MAHAPKISIQFKDDPEEQRSSGAMLIADRVEPSVEPKAAACMKAPSSWLWTMTWSFVNH